MKQYHNYILLFTVFFLFFLSPTVSAFPVPETLSFDLSWLGIKAGTSSMSIKDNGETYKLSSRADSLDWLSIFYKVRDKVESVVEKNHNDFGASLNYKLNTLEGRHRKNNEVIFNSSNKTAIYHDHIDNKREVYNIPDSILDPLAGFYVLRKRNLKVGRSEYVKIFDSKKVWDVEVKVLRKEKVKSPLGVFDTIVVKPLLKSEGIFEKKGDLYIYLTDDERHIPVLVKAKVTVGSVKATLTKIDH